MAGKPKKASTGWGGKRPGAGRPKKKPEASKPIAPDTDMLELLQNIALGITQANSLQVRAAIAAVQYTHVKKGDGGKKDAAKEAAEKAASGRFAPKGPPRLVVNNAK